MKKKLFRSLENILSSKKIVIPFLGLLAASAILVWTTAFVPGNKEDDAEQSGRRSGRGPEGKQNPQRKQSAAEASVPEKITQGAGLSEDSKQCKAITKKGTRCQHMADESGYCRQHRAMFEQVPAESSPQL